MASTACGYLCHAHTRLCFHQRLWRQRVLRAWLGLLVSHPPNDRRLCTLFFCYRVVGTNHKLQFCSFHAHRICSDCCQFESFVAEGSCQAAGCGIDCDNFCYSSQTSCSPGYYCEGYYGCYPCYECCMYEDLVVEGACELAGCTACSTQEPTDGSIGDPCTLSWQCQDELYCLAGVGCWPCAECCLHPYGVAEGSCAQAGCTVPCDAGCSNSLSDCATGEYCDVGFGCWYISLTLLRVCTFL